MKFADLYDDWNTNSIDTTKWNNWGGGNVSAATGQLQITGSTGGGYFGIDSTPVSITNGVTDLAGSFITDQVVSVGNNSITSWEVYPMGCDLYISGPTVSSGNTIWWVILNDPTPKIKAFYTVATVSNLPFVTDYNSALHKYFRIRENAGSFYWDYSADGITYTNAASVANPYSGVTTFLLNVQAGNWQAEATATTAILDNLTIPPTVNDMKMMFR